MIHTDEGYARGEYYSLPVAADRNRKEFDIKNHSLIFMKKQPDILFIGDSITEYWELGAYFQTPGQLIINRGIGGDTTEYLKRRFYEDAVQIHPKHCILGIGINDSADLEGDYWKRLLPRNYDELLSSVKANIASILEMSKKAEIPLILTSLLPIDIPIQRHVAMRKRYILELNEWLKDAAKRDGLIFVDYYPHFLAENSRDQLLVHLTYDGLHPNAKGYARMADVLRETLGKHGIVI